MTRLPVALKALATCHDVHVRYGEGEAAVEALAGASLEILERDSVALLGRSGSGKTTLLHVLGGLVEPTSGSVEWHGRQLSSPGPVGRRGAVRTHKIAYVFQGANLLRYFNTFENIAFAAQLRPGETDPTVVAETLLELVGLGAKLDHLPDELSGGEAQRVAIARALAQEPELLLCDEPTGHLDSDTAERVLDLIELLQREFGFALVVATHDVDVAARLEREIEMQDGRIVREDR